MIKKGLMSNWEILKANSDYEINTAYPYPIRRIGKERIVNEYVEKNNGYVRLNLKGKKEYKHRLVALQWIPNDDSKHKTQVDHINHNKLDNHVENLRWCTASENNKNKSGHKNPFEYIDELPDGAIVVEEYNEHCFDDLYYCDNVFYIYNGIRFRKLNKLKQANSESYFVLYNDNQKKQVKIYYTAFKKKYGLI